MGIFVALIQLIILLPQSYLHQIIKKLCKYYRANYNHHQECGEEEEAEDIRPSPTMVPVPYMSDYVPKLIKKKLPVISLSEMMEYEDMSGSLCAICLNCIDKREEIRLLVNCRHFYHRECMDGWVERGHGTCPLCRLKLLPVEDEDVKAQKDPWREERIVYLFGEDYVHASF